MNSLLWIHRCRHWAVAFLFLAYLPIQISSRPEPGKDQRKIVATNTCFEISPTPGCSDPICESSVCEFFEYCCSEEWGEPCVEEATWYKEGACMNDWPEQSNSCFELDLLSRPGCGRNNDTDYYDDACESIVCEQRPECCNDSYTSECILLAYANCDPPPAENSCLEESREPGCEDLECLQSLCESAASCCVDQYDFYCVEKAKRNSICNPSLPKPSNSCFETNELGGCTDRRCQNAVCEYNGLCCGWKWDDFCIDLAEKACQPVKEELRVGVESCPSGMTCSYDEMANCTVLAAQYNDTFRLGNVLGGIYCGDNGLNEIKNCPRGSYCPNPETKLPCPAGFYCPYKTQTPFIRCERCKEGALELEQDTYGWIVLLMIAIMVVIYIAWGLLNRYNKRVADHVGELEKRINYRLIGRISSKRENELNLEHLRPKLELIGYRLAKLEESHSLAAEGRASGSSKGSASFKGLDFDGKKIKFDAIRVFDVLDSDGSGDLTFDELNVILGLSKKELNEFIRRMNELATGAPSGKVSVTRPVFAKYFLQALTDTGRMTVSYEEAEMVFNEMTKGNTSLKQVQMTEFYSSSMSEFLSDSQILKLIKDFKAVKMNANGAVSDQDQSSSSNSPSSAFRKSLNALRLGQPSTMSLERGVQSEELNAKNSRIATGSSPRTISRELFTAHYPELLMKIMLSEEEDINDDCTELMDSPGVDLCFKDLCLSVNIGRQKVNVVNTVTGRIRGKTMTALMGGSGAGKTSLLNALCGRAHYGETTGTVYINGHKADIESHMDCIGFVPQDDIVYAELTVRENFIFAGKFRLPRGTSDAEISEYADETIANLGLSRVANSPVGDVKRRGVSGGEKKRVNIGLELMAKPSILFLDEPTSGLDASSALLVMKSLNNLVEKNGVTVVSVIHQPRKFIFDLFDSLILLGVGGQMMYHGPTEGAEPYFGRLNYKLPKGESVADWLIDISSGRLEPKNPVALKKDRTMNVLIDDTIEIQTTSKKKTMKESKKKKHSSTDKQNSSSSGGSGVITDDHCVGKQGVTSGRVIRALKGARTRRAWLCDKWVEYIDQMNKEQRTIYEPPNPYELPSGTRKPLFFTQFLNQVRRALIVAWRDRLAKVISSSIIVGSVIFITAMDGVTKVSLDSDPNIPFEVLLIPAESDKDSVFAQLFAYSESQQMQYPLKVGIILCIIVGLTATNTLTSKRLEFFREAGSGYDTNAYFFAINILSTIEHSSQALIAALFATWIRHPVASSASYYVHFLLLSWVTVGWSMLFPMICSPDKVPLIAGFFFAFCGLVFSGAFDPFSYKELYDSGGFKEILAGWISPTRFFFEALTVGEYRCLPEQSGFTIERTSENRNSNNTMMSMMGYAGHDPSAIYRDCGGWYWSVGPVIFIGITVRYLAIGAMHICFRAQQGKKPLLYVLRRNSTLALITLAYCVALVVLVVIVTLLFTSEPSSDENETDDY
mmetsp:Transcript_17412/g.40037  ORF Transcript_17412/g.40037 Transcript_17412/m.40037 type:complete len:1463 (+) Transcript_17412:134-4522(+)